MNDPARSLRTPRLILRSWRDDDLEPFAVMNRDSRVVQYLPGPLEREESDALAARIRQHFAEHDFGRYAVEVIGGPRFIGFVGLAVPPFEAPFMPCVEVGWRLDADHWGRGYATEAALATLAHGFGELGLSEIVSFTVPENRASRRVMEKIGMRHSPGEDFDHPLLPAGHPLRRHVFYRLSRFEWEREGTRL